MTQPLTSSERLANELELLTNPKIPPRFIERARRGYYSDFESPSATPKVDLYNDLWAIGHTDLANRVAAGEFDDTLAEARAWLRGEEAARIFREMFPAISRARWKEILGL